MTRSVVLQCFANTAEKYGFGEKSGVEVAENLSQISTEYPATSAIGQGTNNMTAISLARYVTALATDGKLYTFRLLSKICDANGNVIEELIPEGEQIEGISQSTYDVMREGMYRVVHAAGTAAGAFTGLQIDIAGKSGSVQENLSRANHAILHFIWSVQRSKDFRNGCYPAWLHGIQCRSSLPLHLSVLLWLH